MEIHHVDRRVTYLDLYRYRVPHKIADALKAAFEVNAILVEDHRDMYLDLPSDFDMEAVHREERKRIRPRPQYERSEIERHKAKIEELKTIQKEAREKKRMRKVFRKEEAEDWQTAKKEEVEAEEEKVEREGKEAVIIEDRMVVEAGTEDICPHCGAPLSEELLECPRCGRSI
jgi:hypothetical protein